MDAIDFPPSMVGSTAKPVVTFHMLLDNYDDFDNLEGANVELVVEGNALDRDEGPYGAEGFIRQAIAPLPQFDGNHTVLGSWFAAGEPCGLNVREDASPITKNSSRFLPHAIVG